MGQEKIMNQFLVEVFHEVLRREDAAISSGGFPNLSSREIHVIEVVCRAQERGESENSSAEIARSLGVTAGTLSAAVKVLERKGYLYRRRDDRDKRIVRLMATEEGREANRFHEEFHQKMIKAVLEVLTPEEAAVFVKSLEAIAGFFRRDSAT